MLEFFKILFGLSFILVFQAPHYQMLILIISHKVHGIGKLLYFSSDVKAFFFLANQILLESNDSPDTLASTFLKDMLYFSDKIYGISLQYHMIKLS